MPPRSRFHGLWAETVGFLILRIGKFSMAPERFVVIGGDAAGMSAASQARRRRPEIEIVAFERSPHTSYSA